MTDQYVEHHACHLRTQELKSRNHLFKVSTLYYVLMLLSMHSSVVTWHLQVIVVTMSELPIICHSPDSFTTQGLIAFSISARAERVW